MSGNLIIFFLLLLKNLSGKHFLYAYSVSPPSSLSPTRSTTTVGGKPGSKLKTTSPSKKTISKISRKSPSSSSMVPQQQQQQQNMTEQPITLTYGRGKFVTQITSNVSQLPSAFNFDATKFD